MPLVRQYGEIEHVLLGKRKRDAVLSFATINSAVRARAAGDGAPLTRDARAQKAAIAESATDDTFTVHWAAGDSTDADTTTASAAAATAAAASG